MLFRFAIAALLSSTQSLLVAGSQEKVGGERPTRSLSTNVRVRSRNYIRKMKKDKEVGNKDAMSKEGGGAVTFAEEKLQGSANDTPVIGGEEEKSLNQTWNEYISNYTNYTNSTNSTNSTNLNYLFDQWVNAGADWNHGATAVSSYDSSTFQFNIPEDTQVGDTVFLFLSRSDNYLPLRIPKWERAAECFKTFNKQDVCMRAADCVLRDGPVCLKFKTRDENNDILIGDGRDLNTVVFYRKMTADDTYCWTIDLPGRTITWAITTAIPNVDQNDPIFRVAARSCDLEWASEFPSIYGRKNDVLLLSQSFDDRALKQDFKPPDGTDLIGWTNSNDEAGFVFGTQLTETGTTGDMITGGEGGPKCKDALISIVVSVKN